MAGNVLGRLRKGREFDHVYAEGIVIGGPLFVVRAIRSESQGARWGFAVGKKLSSKAVVRNRVRRRLRDAARGFATTDGWDLVVTARPAVSGATFARIRAEMGRSLARLEQGQ